MNEEAKGLTELSATETPAPQMPTSPEPPSRSAKLSTAIAEAIARNILEQNSPSGTMIGTEAQLMARFDVGRGTLRQAVREIEQHGIARMRQGVGGGLVVDEPARAAAVRILAAYLGLAQVSLAELLEARSLIEVQAVAHAAERVSEADVRHLESLFNSDDDPRHSPPHNANSHHRVLEAITEITGNPAAVLFLQALDRAVLALVPVGAGKAPELTAMLPLMRACRRNIVDAIIAANALAAQQFAVELASSYPVMAAILEQHRRAASILEVADQAYRRDDFSISLGKQKLGDAIARMIAWDIAVRELKAGDRLGLEAELMARYGVGRGVFREVARVLELHGTVTSRRGIHGGLIVGIADPGYSMRYAIMYLHGTGMTREHFRETYKALSLRIAELAATNADEDGLEILRNALAQEDQLSDELFIRGRGALQQAIGMLCGNRALSLLFQTVIMLSTENAADVPAQAIAGFRQSHRQLFDAIASSDPRRARRSMMSHLRLVDDYYLGLAPASAVRRS